MKITIPEYINVVKMIQEGNIATKPILLKSEDEARKKIAEINELTLEELKVDEVRWQGEGYYDLWAINMWTDIPTKRIIARIEDILKYKLEWVTADESILQRIDKDRYNIYNSSQLKEIYNRLSKVS